MAVLYVTEFNIMGQVLGGAPMPQEPPVVPGYGVPIGGSSVQSQTFNPKTRYIELATDAICSIDIGLNPTAVPTARRMAANQTFFRAVPEGGSFRVAVITNT